MFRNKANRNAKTALRGFEGLERRELFAATLLLPYFEVDFTSSGADVTEASGERLTDLAIFDGDFDRG